MSFWNKMLDSKGKIAVKKEYQLGIYSIQLLNTFMTSPCGQRSNIVACDAEGNVVWVAEQPNEDFLYYDMQVDKDANTVIGDNGAGRIYEIEPTSGKILKSALVK